jgi:hypothetical protein
VIWAVYRALTILSSVYNAVSMTMINGAPLPFPLATGKRDSYQWLSTSEHGIDDLLVACPAIVLGKYVAVTSFDSGPLLVDDAQKSSGWRHRGGITYSPRIESLEMAPMHELYDEWYVFWSAV